jgi:hypothetical protein
MILQELAAHKGNTKNVKPQKTTFRRLKNITITIGGCGQLSGCSE